MAVSGWKNRGVQNGDAVLFVGSQNTVTEIATTMPTNVVEVKAAVHVVVSPLRDITPFKSTSVDVTDIHCSKKPLTTYTSAETVVDRTGYVTPTIDLCKTKQNKFSLTQKSAYINTMSG